jgi:hypothetical protein
VNRAVATRTRDFEPVVQSAPRAREAGPAGTVISPAARIAHAAGNQAVQRRIQAKLEVGSPSDPAELEAERIAAAVGTSPPGPGKACACEGSAPGEECAECRARRQPMRRAAEPGAGAWPGPAPAAVRRLLATPGQPLPSATRTHMQAALGRDFGAVRVHTGALAAEATRSIRARAFTVGNTIGFAPGQYDPDSHAGRNLLAHELVHTVQQEGTGAPVARRQLAPVPAAPAPAQPGPPAPDDAAQTALLENEKAAFAKAQARQGQPAVTALYSDPNSPRALKEPPEEETFSIAEVVDRNSGTPIRKGFDAPGPATAYATLVGGDSGAVVLQQDKFDFAAKLAKGKHKMRATAPGITEGDWWTVTPYVVYRVTPAAGVVAVIGVGGYLFPPNVTLVVDPGVARLIPTPAMAAPADAEGLRQIAGVVPPGPAPAGSPPPAANQVPIPEAQQESFIEGYFRSRGLEALAANSEEVERLAKVFAPTVEGTQSTPAHGVSDEARAVIAHDREEAKLYARLLEQEVKVAALLDYLAVCQDRGEFPPFYPLYHKDQKAQVAEMVKKIQRVQSDVQKRKFDILSRSPLIGQLVGIPDPKDRFSTTERIHPDLAETPKFPTIHGKNAVDESPLAAPASPESDETIRASFVTKLDAVRKAIRSARSEMYGDADFLLGFEGLAQLVTADFNGISGPNAGLKDKLKTMLASHAKSEKTIEIAGTVVQFALLLIPGGAFLSAALGMGMAVRKMDQGLRRWTVSQASVNPAAALVDQNKVEDELTNSTIDLAVNAVFIATETINGLKALDTGGKEKALQEAFEKLEKNEAERATVKEVAAGSHTVQVTEKGIEVCSPRPCPLLRVEFAAELERDTARGGTLKKELEEAEALRATNPEAAAQAGRQVETKLMEERLGAVLGSVEHDAPALLTAAKISEATAKLTAEFPFLTGLSPGAVERVVRAAYAKDVGGALRLAKSWKSAVRGQLLEEIAGARVRSLLATPAGREAMGLAHITGELHFIEGSRVRTLGGAQLSDGIIVAQEEGKLKVVAVIESKAGTFAAGGLAESLGGLKRASTSDIVQALFEASPSSKAGPLGQIASIDPDLYKLIVETRGANTAADVERLSAAREALMDAIGQLPQDDVARLRGLLRHGEGQISRDVERFSEVASEEGLLVDGQRVDIDARQRPSFLAAVPSKVDATSILQQVEKEGYKIKALDLGEKAPEKEQLDKLAKELVDALGADLESAAKSAPKTP